VAHADGTRANDERRQCEVDTVAAKEQLEKTVTDSSDVIRYLQRSLQSRDDQVQELKERLNGLQLVRKAAAADGHWSSMFVLFCSRLASRKAAPTRTGWRRASTSTRSWNSS
jgi:predicted RNase H-like nuclease (RuvC/YqgF family)